MVLKLANAAFSAFFPTQYFVHIVAGIVAILVFHAFSQGRSTNRDRDLHARVILVTGGFTPLGLTVIQTLAQRGAHIIALSPYPIDSPKVTILITLLRTTTNNEQIYAEQCDLASPSSIKAFCMRFLTGQEPPRVDAIIFAHEYQHIGPLGFKSRNQDEDARNRETGSLATFHITTLLMPALLAAPVERDIRLVNVVNRFYAAAAVPSFSPSFPVHVPSATAPKKRSLFLQEGTRALRTSIFTRHLQRIFDAIPAPQVPKTDDGSSTVPVVSPKAQKSNIVAVSVSPGISRVDTMAPLLHADWTLPSGSSSLGIILYLLLQPLLRIFTKSPTSAMQTVLHVLFLPTPFKVLSQTVPKSAEDKPETKASLIDKSVTEMPEEVLKPGALYAECAVVKLKVPALISGAETSDKAKGKQKADADDSSGLKIPDDDEFGGEITGRLVWEAYEEALKAWEVANPAKEEERNVAPDIDQDNTLEGDVGPY